MHVPYPRAKYRGPARDERVHYEYPDIFSAGFLKNVQLPYVEWLNDYVKVGLGVFNYAECNEIVKVGRRLFQSFQIDRELWQSAMPGPI